MVFVRSLLHKGLISDEILWFYEIQVLYIKFIDKFQKLLVCLNDIKKQYVDRSNLRNSSDIAKVFRFDDPGTLKALNINQYCITKICKILSWVTI